MNSVPGRLTIAAIGMAALCYGASRLLKAGLYGWTIFVTLPLFAGALVSFCLRPQSSGQAIKIGALTGCFGSCFFLMLGAEGILCVLLAAPLLIPVAIAGSWLTYWIRAGGGATAPTAMVMLLPFSLFFDRNARPPVYQVTTRMVMNATPDQIWEHVVAFPEIPNTGDWLSRTGIAFPKRTRILGQGIGAARYCDLSTGPVVERVTVWDKPRLLRFSVSSTPPCMQEAGLYGQVDAKHLNGYFVSRQGQFKLLPLRDGRTLVEGTSWYQHGVWPAQYWRWWSDAIVHCIHAVVLNHIRHLSEKQSLNQKPARRRDLTAPSAKPFLSRNVLGSPRAS